MKKIFIVLFGLLAGLMLSDEAYSQTTINRVDLGSRLTADMFPLAISVRIPSTHTFFATNGPIKQVSGNAFSIQKNPSSIQGGMDLNLTPGARIYAEVLVKNKNNGAVEKIEVEGYVMAGTGGSYPSIP